MLSPKAIKAYQKEINSLVSNNKHITNKRIKSISLPLFNECLKLSKIVGIEGKWQKSPITAALYVILNKSKYTCSCGSNLPFAGWSKGFQEHCSSKCAGINSNTKAKRAQTCINKYGVDAVQKVPLIRKKFKRSMKKAYGVEYSGHSKQILEKKLKTNAIRYNSTSPWGCKIVQRKSKTTILKKYGVEHVMQCRDIHDKQQKSGFKIRELKIDNKLFKVRGYEPEAIIHLIVHNKVKAKNILVTHAEGNPTIKWKDSDGKTRSYFPDMLCKIKNRWFLIEVKSTYTAGLLADTRTSLSRLRKKARYCKKAGYTLKTIIVSAQRKPENRVCTIIDNIENKNKKTIIQELKFLHPDKYFQL